MYSLLFVMSVLTKSLCTASLKSLRLVFPLVLSSIFIIDVFYSFLFIKSKKKKKKKTIAMLFHFFGICMAFFFFFFSRTKSEKLFRFKKPLFIKYPNDLLHCLLRACGRSRCRVLLFNSGLF